eukprot:scaffold2848_cov150-Skeletonema_menzelii.AAC.36
MKRPNPFLYAYGRKRPRTDSCDEKWKMWKPTTSPPRLTPFPHYTPGLFAEPQDDHAQRTDSRLEPAKSEVCSLLLSFRSAKRIAPPNNDDGHGINFIAKTSTKIDIQWNQSPDTIKLDLPTKSSPDETYLKEILMLYFIKVTQEDMGGIN